MTNPESAAVPNQPDPLGTLALPRQGVLMGIDHGTKRLGVALSDVEQTISMPLETYQIVNEGQTQRKLLRWLEDYRVKGIVVGLPVRMSGEEGDQAAIVRRFGEWISQVTKMPVGFWDERHTSTEAQLRLWERGMSPEKHKGKLDGIAAQLMLQAFLNAPRRDELPKPYGESNSTGN